ncbi:protein sidekick-1-like [Actinia tenebrosa]|uniref:Protein sidekick-1-like n=1 Tax=Actinia tenebrosa TaxID=6105 RepID=A0A6P8H2Q0_ACTTE|nr:protein sidekick-1-like [Actinia tenebrosa]XP_031549874.1 protein sidekick-1-like [Actinia tenebrosa]
MGVLIGLFGVVLILGNTVKESCAVSSGVSPGKPTELTLSNSLESSADHGVIATIRWRAPPSNSTLSFYVRYQEDKSSNPSQKRVTSNSAVIYLKPNTKYRIKIMALDEASRQGPWSDDFIIQTGDSVPTKAPDNVTAVSRDASSIRITWQPIPKKYHNGILLGYIVFYRKRDTNKWQRQTISSADTYSYIINGLLPGESYIIAVAGYTKNGTGKKSIDVGVDRSLPTPNPTTQHPTTSSSTKEVAPSTKEATSPKTMANNIPKPSTTEAPIILEVYSELFSTPTVIAKSPDAQANKDITESKTSSLELVYKFIAPGAIGGLILVLLIVCFMWHQRRSKKKRKHQQEMEAMSLQTLSENMKSPTRKDTVKLKGEVTRGEGSIRYAPPKSIPQEDSLQRVNITPNQLAQFDECHTTLSVISESEPSGKCQSQAACKSPDETTEKDPNRRRQYAEICVGNSDKVEDERYVKHGDKSRIYAEPFSVQPAPSSPAKSTSSEAKYENMQNLYEFLDVKDDQGNPLYMNIDGFGEDLKPEGEDLYEEIPADRPESHSEEHEPLLLQSQRNEEDETK